MSHWADITQEDADREYGHDKRGRIAIPAEAVNPDIGPRCPECRVGLGTHDARDPHCIDHEEDK